MTDPRGLEKFDLTEILKGKQGVVPKPASSPKAVLVFIRGNAVQVKSPTSGVRIIKQ